jgi:hypothetical protein
VEISFDPVKRAWTLAERGLDFADAGKVFAGTVFEFEDERSAYPERRYSTIGMLDDRMVVVIWVDAEDGRRVILMRKANARERTRFGRYLA